VHWRGHGHRGLRRALIWLNCLALLCGIVFSANARGYDPDAAPPLDSHDETLAENPELETACLNAIISTATARHWVLGRSLMVYNEMWEWVWRVDFRLDNEPGTGVNRILCWRAAEGRLDIAFAIGQDIVPL
jgi:hypothetical protein